MGISVKGKVAGEEACDLGIHIKSIIKGGAAAKVGKYDDQHILSFPAREETSVQSGHGSGKLNN